MSLKDPQWSFAFVLLKQLPQPWQPITWQAIGIGSGDRRGGKQTPEGGGHSIQGQLPSESADSMSSACVFGIICHGQIDAKNPAVGRNSLGSLSHTDAHAHTRARTHTQARTHT